MNAEAGRSWLPLAVVAGYLAWRWLAFRWARTRLPELMSRGGVIVDVRSPGEYAAGAAAGSVNMPLGELAERAKELDRAKPVVVCCASGSRSALAARLLRGMGFVEVINVGPWTNARRS